MDRGGEEENVEYVSAALGISSADARLLLAQHENAQALMERFADGSLHVGRALAALKNDAAVVNLSDSDDGENADEAGVGLGLRRACRKE